MCFLKKGLNKKFFLIFSVFFMLVFFILFPCPLFAQSSTIRGGFPASGRRTVDGGIVLEKNNVEAGEAFGGRVWAKVYPVPGAGANFCNVGVDFDPGPSPLDITFACNYDPEHAGGQDYVICQRNFVHSYTQPGRYVIVLLIDCGIVSRSESAIVTVVTSTRPALVVEFATPITATTIEAIIERVANILFWLFFSVGIIFILLGGLQILTSAGVPENVARGKQTLTYALLGMGILALARGIVSLIYLLLPIRTP